MVGGIWCGNKFSPWLLTYYFDARDNLRNHDTIVIYQRLLNFILLVPWSIIYDDYYVLLDISMICEFFPRYPIFWYLMLEGRKLLFSYFHVTLLNRRKILKMGFWENVAIEDTLEGTMWGWCGPRAESIGSCTNCCAVFFCELTVVQFRNASPLTPGTNAQTFPCSAMDAQGLLPGGSVA
jgi:hypothetical protein